MGSLEKPLSTVDSCCSIIQANADQWDGTARIGEEGTACGRYRLISGPSQHIS